jgi:hypothetical protein
MHVIFLKKQTDPLHESATWLFLQQVWLLSWLFHPDPLFGSSIPATRYIRLWYHTRIASHHWMQKRTLLSSGMCDVSLATAKVASSRLLINKICLNCSAVMRAEGFSCLNLRLVSVVGVCIRSGLCSHEKITCLPCI